MTYEQTLEFLFEQLPMYQRLGKAAFKKNLDNTLALSRLLNQPEKKFKSIHIAGTNGKGSTAHMLASIFQIAGFKTGLYTSPHLKDFRERIRVNGQMISKEKVVDFVQNHQSIFSEIQPSFFEWSVALAFNYFANSEVDIAIIETGLGGRLDSTNIIHPELSVITNISLDHTDMLGDSLQQIAKEKSGIIKENTPVVIGNHSDQRELFNQIAFSNNAPIYFSQELEGNVNLETDLKGSYQTENLKTVLQSWIVLRKMGWKISFTHLQKGLLEVVNTTGLRGRWEVLGLNPKIIADTAHNEEGLKQCMQQLSRESFRRLHLVIGFVKDKNIPSILSLLPKKAHYYFCQASVPRAMEVDSLVLKAKNHQLFGNAYSSPKEALTASLQNAEKEDLIYIGGSNFVVAEIL